jgi:acyl dehydratase
MGLYYEDYEALGTGHSWRSADRLVTAQDIAFFAALTGDDHPQHTSEEYGRASPYGARIAHGYLTASLASGLAYRIGLDKDTSHAILETSWRFSAPVLIGDVLHVIVTLGALRPSRSHQGMGIVSRRYDVMNQADVRVAIGTLTILCKRRP